MCESLGVFESVKGPVFNLIGASAETRPTRHPNKRCIRD